MKILPTIYVSNIHGNNAIGAQTSARSSGRSRDQSRVSGEDQDESEDECETHNELKSRNRHLLKVYLVSLIQLLVVLCLVIFFTEVEQVREFQENHRWIGVLAVGEYYFCNLSLIYIEAQQPPIFKPLILMPQLIFILINQILKNFNIHMFILVSMMCFLCFWILLLICCSFIRHTPRYNLAILIIFTLCEGILLGM